MKVIVKIMQLSTDLTIVADDAKNTLLVHEKNANFNPQAFIDRISVITSRWAPRYTNNTIIDGEEFLVKFIDNKFSHAFVGKNSFPPNYGDFKQLIAEVLRPCN